MHVTDPELQAKIDQWVTETGRTADELAEVAMTGYFEELAQVRETLDSRYDDLKSGRVQPIDGEEALEQLRQREEKLRKSRRSPNP